MSACATRLSPPILDALDCASIIPPSYRNPVPPAPLPPPDATAGDLWSFADGQTTALDEANGRSSDLVALADACEDRQRHVFQELEPPSLGERLKSILPHGSTKAKGATQ